MHHTQQLPRGLQTGAVDLRLVRRVGFDEQVRGKLAPLVDRRGGNAGVGCTVAHQRGVMSDAVRGQVCDVADGFDDIGLAKTVAADKKGNPRLQPESELGPGAKVPDIEIANKHRA